jgi:peptide chain release factor 2
MSERSTRSEGLNGRIGALVGAAKLPAKRERLEILDAQIGDPEFWNDPETAATVNQERTRLCALVAGLDALSQRGADTGELIELAEMEADEETLVALDDDMTALEGEIAGLEFRRMLSGPHDASAAIVQIKPGAGGTESMDWAGMLYRMLTRFSERRGWKVEILDYQDGEEAGIAGATFQVTGDYAYGYLKSETGVHRLVRISPFDANKRRHTSFAAVSVIPELDDAIDIEILDSDLRVDTYRSSGAGGQHVNKTDSAIRLTHLPTGIVVACQQERSQHKNRARAMKVLAAKLYELEEQKKNEARDQLAGDQAAINFGSQIRNYVLQPYQMVKDLRTGHEVGQPQAVLDGDLDGFIEAFLLHEA